MKNKNKKWHEFQWWKDSINYERRDRAFEKELDFIADSCF